MTQFFYKRLLRFILVDLLKKGNYVLEIPFFYSLYDVAFEVIALFGTGSEWHNIIHFTQGGNNSKYGDRIPGVWLHPNNRQLKICSAVGADKNYCYTPTKEISTTKFTKIKISQNRDDKTNKFLYQIYIDGKLEHSLTNNNPTTFYNVKPYLSNPWSPPARALVKNLKIKISSEGLNNFCYRTKYLFF